MSVLKLQNVDFSNLKFSSSRNKTGRRFVGAFYDKKPLVVAFPKLRIPFNSQVSQYGALEFSLTTDKKDDLVANLTKLDKQMETFAKELGWFDDDNYRYNPVLKVSQKGNYAPTIKFKIPKKDGEITTHFYDADKKPITVNDDSDVLNLLQANSNVVCIVECGGAWFSVINGVQNYGLYWKVTHLRVYPNENKQSLRDYIFEESEDDLETPEDYLFDE